MTFKIFFHPDFNCWYRSFNGSTFGCCLRVADFTASGDFHPAPEILTYTNIIKISCRCTPESGSPGHKCRPWCSPKHRSLPPGHKKAPERSLTGATGLALYVLLPPGNLYTYLTTAPATVFATRARSLTTLPLSAG